jgi:hypothetical protein
MGSRTHIWATLALLGLLSACGGDPDLLVLTDDEPGPDEFAIVPNRPLEQPQNLAELPPPTPGGSNRSDVDPLGDATRALGGRPGGATAPVQGQALIAHTTRFGVAPGIRAPLAAEDRAFREENRGRLLERLFGSTTYFGAYEPQSLDQYRELERLRAAGIRTPAAPPEGVPNAE